MAAASINPAASGVVMMVVVVMMVCAIAVMAVVMPVMMAIVTVRTVKRREPGMIAGISAFSAAVPEKIENGHYRKHNQDTYDKAQKKIASLSDFRSKIRRQHGPFFACGQPVPPQRA
jgi:hypothetical protein